MGSNDPLELSYRTVGDGPPLIILHGLLGSGRNWSGIAQALAGERRCILPDLRNHGASPWSDEVGYDAMAGDVAALLDRLTIATATVIGHSMGGKVATALASAQPSRVDRLVLVDIAPLAYPIGYAHEIDALMRLPIDRLGSRAEADQSLAPSVPEPTMRGFLLQNLERDDGSWRWRANLAALRAGLRAIAAAPVGSSERVFDRPTAIIRGTRSGYIGEEQVAATRRLMPRSVVRDVEDAGHWPHAERPERFLEVLRAILTDAR